VKKCTHLQEKRWGEGGGGGIGEPHSRDGTYQARHKRMVPEEKVTGGKSSVIDVDV